MSRMARVPPVCSVIETNEITGLPDAVIVGPCPYPAGSAEKIVWLTERWNRFAISLPRNQTSHVCPQVMHHEDDLKCTESINRITNPTLEPRVIITKCHIRGSSMAAFEE